MFRYLVAITVAGAFVAGGLLFARYWRHPLDGFDIEVTPTEMRLIEISHALSRFWFVWIPLVFSTCGAIAYFFGPAGRR